MTSRRVELAAEPAVAWSQLKSAAAQLGKIEEKSDGSRFLILKMRYGLNPVRMRVSVLSAADGQSSVLDIQGRGQDVWGVASRKAIDRLCLAIQAAMPPPRPPSPPATAPQSSGSRFCEQCGGAVSASAKFCSGCGTAVASQ
jgi:hypothetical protein